MIEPTPRAPDLEAGLAEIDRRLGEIQDELSGGDPPPRASGEQPAPPPSEQPAPPPSEQPAPPRASTEPEPPPSEQPAPPRAPGEQPAPPRASTEPEPPPPEERSPDPPEHPPHPEARLAPENAPPPETRPGRSGPLAAALQRAARSQPPRREQPAEAAPEPTREQPPYDVAREQLDDLQRELDALADLRDRLLASIRELVDGYQALAHAQPGAARRAGSSRQANPELTVSVGPFATLDEVRAFERAVASLPGVRETSLRGFEGTDRAIVDVRLGPG